MVKPPPEKEILVYKLIESMGSEVNHRFRNDSDGSLNDIGYLFAVMMVDSIPETYAAYRKENLVTPENLPRKAQVCLANVKIVEVQNELLRRSEFPEDLKTMIALNKV